MVVFDKSGMYESLENIYLQIDKACEIAKDASLQKPVNNIFIAGAGASAMAGHILKQYMKDSKIPIFVVEDYSLPDFADSASLVFVVSYDEISDEPLLLYKESHKRGCQTIVISAGAKLRELASHNKTKHLTLPQDIHPRLVYTSVFFIILKLLENSNLIDEQGDYVKKTLKILRHNKFEDITEAISGKIVSKVPLIFASTKYEVVAKKWKLSFNETTEVQSFYGVFPGAFHNEIAGFAKRNSEFHVIIVKGDDEDAHLSKKMLTFKNLLKDLNVSATEIGLAGECYLAKIFSALLIGEWLAYKLAINYGVEPSSRRVINEFEKRLKL
jgi:glucose/mannose-6-phosphate isomerase